MKGKVCLVTGANAGIGLATSWLLAEMGATVVMVARSPERGQPALEEVRRKSSSSDVHLLTADLSSLAQVRKLAEDFVASFEHLDVLVNNAAVIPPQRQVSVDGFEMQWAVNHLAYFLLTNLLLETLKASAPARVVNVSSQVHSSGGIDFEDLNAERGYRPTGVYANTKLANVLFTYELARRLAGSGVTANCLHPGVINTQLNHHYMGHTGRVSPPDSELERGAAMTVHLASSPEVEGVTGRYFSYSAERPSSEVSQDNELARRLWEVSAQMVELKT
jgi:NAD(P)-dependent dehydrogenase (short-subunit alcohol dehydrogenase family)